MTTRPRVARVAGASLIVTAIAVAVLPARSQEATAGETAWWHRAQPGGSLALAPPPPSPVVPAGGMYVALAANPDPGAPFAPIAVAALRFRLTPGADAVLNLDVAEGHRAGIPGAPYAIEACPALTSWEPVQGGPWDARPLGDCGRFRVVGLANADGSVVSFELPAAAQDIPGALDLVLTPTGSMAFETAFDPPKDASLVVFGVPDPEEDENGVEDEGFVDDEAPFEPSFEPESSAFPDSPFAPGAIVAAPSVTPPAVAPPSRPPLAARPVVRRVPRFLPDDRFERASAVSLLLLLGGAVWWFGAQPARPPRLLGSLGGASVPVGAPPEVAGVGRFARPRTARPPRL